MTSTQFVLSVKQRVAVPVIERFRKSQSKTLAWDSHGNLPLYSLADAMKFAVMYRHRKYIRFLLEKFPKEVLNEEVCCPLLFMAVMRRADDILELLCSHSQRARVTFHGVPYIDARACCKLEGGKTALHLAVETGNVNAVRILLRFGADTSVVDKFGNTAFDCGLLTMSSLLGRQDEFPHVRRRLHKIDPEKNAKDILICLLELSKCLTHIGVLTIAILKEFFTSYFPKEGDLPFDCFVQTIKCLLQPPSLLRTCRVTIREELGSFRLPDGIYELGLPHILTNYLDLGMDDYDYFD